METIYNWKKKHTIDGRSIGEEAPDDVGASTYKCISHNALLQNARNGFWLLIGLNGLSLIFLHLKLEASSPFWTLGEYGGSIVWYLSFLQSNQINHECFLIPRNPDAVAPNRSCGLFFNNPRIKSLASFET